MSPRIAVVGGGLTGLTAAWRLQSAGCAVTVFERTDAVGGRTRSIRRDGFIFDVGAITMLPTYPVYVPTDPTKINVLGRA